MRSDNGCGEAGGGAARSVDIHDRLSPGCCRPGAPADHLRPTKKDARIIIPVLLLCFQ